MIFPENRVAEICRWTPEQSLDALDKGRAGDLVALGEWSVRAIFSAYHRQGLPRLRAEKLTKEMLEKVNITAKVAL